MVLISEVMCVTLLNSRLQQYKWEVTFQVHVNLFSTNSNHKPNSLTYQSNILELVDM